MDFTGSPALFSILGYWNESSGMLKNLYVSVDRVLLMYTPSSMIVNLLRLPGSYQPNRGQTTYRQAGDSHMVDIPNSYFQMDQSNTSYLIYNLIDQFRVDQKKAL